MLCCAVLCSCGAVAVQLRCGCSAVVQLQFLLSAVQKGFSRSRVCVPSWRPQREKENLFLASHAASKSSAFPAFASQLQSVTHPPTISLSQLIDFVFGPKISLLVTAAAQLDEKKKKKALSAFLPRIRRTIRCNLSVCLFRLVTLTEQGQEQAKRMIDNRQNRNVVLIAIRIRIENHIRVGDRNVMFVNILEALCDIFHRPGSAHAGITFVTHKMKSQ